MSNISNKALQNKIKYKVSQHLKYRTEKVVKYGSYYKVSLLLKIIYKKIKRFTEWTQILSHGIISKYF